LDIKKAYNNWAEEYDSVKNPTRDLDEKILKKILAEKSFDTLIEAGCGTGKNTSWLQFKAKKIVAFDFSEEMLAIAKNKINNKNVEFSQQDITNKWGFENKCADLVTINLVLEHIENLENVFAEAFRVLKNSGQLIICEYHPEKQKAGKGAKFFDKNTNQEIEINFYQHSIEEFETEAQKAGFKNIKIKNWFDDEKNEKIPRIISIIMSK